MSNPKVTSPISESSAPRKPRIAIMGEFSVGKSTLSNLLIGSNPLPVRVTATQLPPVWLSYGDQDAYREDLEGKIFPVDIDRLDQVPLEDTSVIRIFIKADVLELCDLIDMPGISDPNMSPEVWQRVLHNADGVLWCTHATQAWRQTEAAVWKSMPPELFNTSLLLVTRIDKLLTEQDRQKVIKRVRRETEGLFSGLFPISLTEALKGFEDQNLWEMSGAEAFTQSLVDLTHSISKKLGQSGTNPVAKSFEPSGSQGEPRPELRIPSIGKNPKSFHTDPKVHRLEIASRKEQAGAPSVTPARVRASPGLDRVKQRPDQNAAATIAVPDSPGSRASATN